MLRDSLKTVHRTVFSAKAAAPYLGEGVAKDREAGWSEGETSPSFIFFFQIRVPVSGVENACCYYSTYNAEKDASVASDNKKKIMIFGGGPNRIGQGIEFESQAASHLAKRVLASKNSQDNIGNINSFLK